MGGSLRTWRPICRVSTTVRNYVNKLIEEGVVVVAAHAGKVAAR